MTNKIKATITAKQLTEFEVVFVTQQATVKIHKFAEDAAQLGKEITQCMADGGVYSMQDDLDGAYIAVNTEQIIALHINLPKREGWLQ